MGKSKEATGNPLLRDLRKNRYELRRRGLTGADILAVETLANILHGRKRSLRVADLARLLGVSRQAAWRRVGRLEVLGAVFRVGGAVQLNLRGLMAWALDGVKGRLQAASRRFHAKKAGFVTSRVSHTVKNKKQGLEQEQQPSFDAVAHAAAAVVGSVADNLAALRAMYVPLHLRAHRG